MDNDPTKNITPEEEAPEVPEVPETPESLEVPEAQEAPKVPEAPESPAESSAPEAIAPASEAQTDPVANTLADTPASGAPAPKKKTGLLVGIIIAVLVLAGGAIAIFALLSGGGDDVKKATSKFFDTITAVTSKEESNAENKNLKVDGKIELISKGGASPSPDADNTSSYIPSAQGMNLEMRFGLEANDYSDSRFFLSINNASIPMLGLTFDKTIGAEIKSFAGNSTYLKLNGLEQLGSSIFSLFLGSQATSIFDKIDNTWYKIEAGDIASTGIDGLDSKTIECMTSADPSKIIGLFSEKELSEVITLEKYTGDEEKADSGTLYILKINKDGAEDFIKRLNEEFNKLKETCNLPLKSSTKIEDFTDENFPDVFVVIDKEEISRIYTKVVADGAISTISLDFSYPKSINIEEPTDAKPAEDLIDEIINLFNGTGGGGDTTCPLGYTYDYFEEKCVYDDENDECPTGWVYDTEAKACLPSSDPEYDPVVEEIFNFLMDELSGETFGIEEDDLKETINNLVVCLDDAGVHINSFEELEDYDDSDENVNDCTNTFQTELEALLDI